MEGYFDDNKAWIIPTAVGATSLAVGFFAGIFYARHSVRRIVVVQEATVYTEVEEEPELEEVDRNQLKIDYDEALTEYTPALEMAHGDTDDQNYGIEPASIIELIVENPADGTSHKHKATMGTWDYEREMARRDPEEPYVIHMDEFLENESGYSQTTVEYYQGDDTMADENDVPIDHYQAIFGFLKFGHGSNSRHTVYIRNDRLQAEYEVLLNFGSFREEVLGIREIDKSKKDLKHSVGKFHLD
jgi:hypothetical protein